MRKEHLITRCVVGRSVLILSSMKKDDARSNDDNKVACNKTTCNANNIALNSNDKT